MLVQPGYNCLQTRPVRRVWTFGHDNGKHPMHSLVVDLYGTHFPTHLPEASRTVPTAWLLLPRTNAHAVKHGTEAHHAISCEVIDFSLTCSRACSSTALPWDAPIGRGCSWTVLVRLSLRAREYCLCIRKIALPVAAEELKGCQESSSAFTGWTTRLASWKDVDRSHTTHRYHSIRSSVGYTPRVNCLDVCAISHTSPNLLCNTHALTAPLVEINMLLTSSRTLSRPGKISVISSARIPHDCTQTLP